MLPISHDLAPIALPDLSRAARCAPFATLMVLPGSCGLASADMLDRLPQSAPRHWHPGLITTIARGHTPPWAMGPPAARLHGCTTSSCFVRPKGPLLRPDLLPSMTAVAGRGKDRRKRPAAAGAQRPCGGPSLRSRSLKEGPLPDALNNVLGNDSQPPETAPVGDAQRGDGSTTWVVVPSMSMAPFPWHLKPARPDPQLLAARLLARLPDIVRGYISCSRLSWTPKMGQLAMVEPCP
jgi:hypothetical protein